MSEITYPYIRDYIESIQPNRPPRLEEMRRLALEDKVPIIKHEMEHFLKVILKMHQPKRILEIGTAVGYSASLMALCLDQKTHITTLELSTKMCEKALSNFEMLGLTETITLIPGDALETIKTLEGPFDLIFMDAAKGQYMTLLPEVLRLLSFEGILISDNVLQNGFIAKSRFAIPRRQRTIHQNMRQYLWEINHRPDLVTSIIPIADGATLSIKVSSS